MQRNGARRRRRFEGPPKGGAGQWGLWRVVEGQIFLSLGRFGALSDPSILSIPSILSTLSIQRKNIKDRKIKMSQTIDAVPDRIEAQQQYDEVAVADDASSLDFLTAIYRDPRQPMPRRMRAAIEAAPFFHPKLAVNANISGGEDFASRLERAIARSGKVVSPAPLLLPLPRAKVE
jgi:hypothetical protein